MQGDGTISFKHPLSVSWACGGVAGVGAAVGETPGLREDAPALELTHIFTMFARVRSECRLGLTCLVASGCVC